VRRLLGVDLGERRIGLAVADGDGSAARPFDTIRRRRKLADDAATLAQLVAAQGIVELVVGLPLEASGEHGPQAELTTAWAAQIADALGLPLTMRDERLTSHVAEQRLGPMKRGRSGGPPTRAQRDAYRARVDREAAAIILQDEIEARAGVQYASPANPQRTETSP
jgi:putative Holliday junction resolvase